MDSYILIVVIITIFVVVIIFSSRNKANSSETLNDIGKGFGYKRKDFLSNSEKQFLDTLKGVEKYGLIIVPQINLATVIAKIGEYKWQTELYRNIDFGVFTNEYKLLLLIELNDSTHQQNKRKSRDIKIKDIVDQANIRLITFYTDKPNKPEYVVNRVVEEIKALKK